MSTMLKKRLGEPIFKKIKSDLIAKVTSGKLSPGQRLSDERTLAKEYNVSRDTIRRALEHLSEEKVIDRIQGDGTYIRDQAPVPAQKIAAIFYGFEVPGEEYMFSTLSLLGRRAAMNNTELMFRSYVNRAELEAGIKELGKTPNLLGGILLSANTLDEIETIRDLASFPLVLMGDMAFPNRTRLVINQITGSNYHWGLAAGQELMKRSCTRLAVVMIDRYFVWTAEFIQGCFDACRFLAEPMKKVFAFQKDSEVDIRPPNPLAMIAWAERLVKDWQETGWMPDGILTQTPWITRVLAQTLVNAGIPIPQMPVFVVRADQGISISQDYPEIEVIVVRTQGEVVIDNAIRRLKEIQAGDTTRKIEILLQEVYTEELSRRPDHEKKRMQA
jgi:DNA-binding transcriptional regulator YhcF (GntR family)